ncbi:MAG: A24 family peptidase [Acidobacteriota bacterium]
MELWISSLAGCAIGAVAGHLARRAVPRLLGAASRELPFAWPWMEATGALLGVTVALWGGTGGDRLAAAGLALLVLLACGTDYEAKLLPFAVTSGGALFGLAVAPVAWRPLLDWPLHRALVSILGLEPGPLSGLALAGLGAASGWLAIASVRSVFSHLATLEVMGGGDVQLAMALGAFLGPVGALVAIALSFVLGVVHGVACAAVLRQPHAPFGPPLAMAALVARLAGDSVLGGIVALRRALLALPVPLLAGLYVALLLVAVVLILRVRARARDYEEWIEADYREVEARLDGVAGAEESTRDSLSN